MTSARAEHAGAEPGTARPAAPAGADTAFRGARDQHRLATTA